MVTVDKVISRVTETRWSKLYIAIAALQCIIIIALQVAICYQNTLQARILNNSPNKYSDFMTTAIARFHEIKWENVAFIGFQVFFFGMACDATVYQNTAEILALAILNIICAILGALEVFDGIRWLDRLKAHSQPTDPLTVAEKIEIALSVTILSFACVMAYLSYQMSKQFGWNIYKKIGADIQIQKMYRVFQFFVLGLKIDIYIEFMVSLFYVIQFSIRPNGLDSQSMFQIVATALILPMLYFARTAVSAESKTRMIIFIVFQVMIFIDFIFIFIATLKDASWYTWIVLVWIGIAFNLATSALGFICMRNFGKGLKPFVQRGPEGKRDLEMSKSQANDNWQIDDDDD
ncbi:hypothetical protein DFQ28_006769 [Apophysomyces sp. BC1034]|nr:hypothetical protein DFQ30_004874 [Apophysomyces sp. BC1015]KAG0178714.1 hypothetical protein DFQ29_003079 [Apophysomyces sp. BC1021]KAG0193028.1 hypothetical protein DFQ28_006769 [Apophysomyces sp. BC1034]